MTNHVRMAWTVPTAAHTVPSHVPTARDQEASPGGSNTNAGKVHHVSRDEVNKTSLNTRYIHNACSEHFFSMMMKAAMDMLWWRGQISRLYGKLPRADDLSSP